MDDFATLGGKNAKTATVHVCSLSDLSLVVSSCRGAHDHRATDDRRRQGHRRCGAQQKCTSQLLRTRNGADGLRNHDSDAFHLRRAEAESTEDNSLATRWHIHVT